MQLRRSRDVPCAVPPQGWQLLGKCKLQFRRWEQQEELLLVSVQALRLFRVLGEISMESQRGLGSKGRDSSPRISGFPELPAPFPSCSEGGVRRRRVWRGFAQRK